MATAPTATTAAPAVGDPATWHAVDGHLYTGRATTVLANGRTIPGAAHHSPACLCHTHPAEFDPLH